MRNSDIPDFELDFEEMGIDSGDGYGAGSFTGMAFCVVVAGEAVVVGISVDENKYLHHSRTYEGRQRMLDRSKPDDRALFHLLAKSFLSTHREQIEEEIESLRPVPVPPYQYDSTSAGRTFP